MRSFLSHFYNNNNSVEYAGAGEISPEIKFKIRLRQVKTIFRLTPAMMIASLFFMLVLIGITKTEREAPELSIWSTLMVIAVIINIAAWWWWPKKRDQQPSLKVAVGVILVSAFIYGCFWGAMPSVMLASGDDSDWLYIVAVMAGVACGAGFSLSAMPQALAIFMGPVVAGLLFAVNDTGTAIAATLAFTLIVFTLVILLTSISFAQSLVKRIDDEMQLKEQKAVISLLLRDFEENSSDWLWETDAENRIINASSRFSEVTGLPSEVLNGTEITSLADARADELTLMLSAFVESVNNRLTFRDMTIPVVVKGEQHWWSITGKPVYRNDGSFKGFTGVCSDITEQRRSEEKVKFLAHNDALTGLVNRTQFTEQLNQHVVKLERYGTPFSVLYVDLDRFKAVNDTRGHPTGDKLLSKIGQRLRSEVRESDVLARVGGDEFTIICNDGAEGEYEANLAQRIIDKLSVPFEIDGEKITIGASIGIARAPLNGTQPDQILRNADLALYRAKSAGKGRYQFFKAEMDSTARERRALESELREAMANNEFELNYQPLMDIESRMPTGFEALIRWRHPIRDTVSPAEFIPLAEKMGLINAIGEWVINEACETAMTWPEEHTVAVNLSAHQFEDDHIVEVVENALAKSGLDASRLELEVTESLLIDQPDEVIETLRKLKKLGVSIAMDDFGTGYSSLSYLMKFPFDKMKIDRSFVVALDTDTAARDILKTIGSLGDSLEMKITVEGVETKEHVEFLSKMSCHQLQGFYFAKPLKKDDIAAYLLNQAGSLMRQTEQSPAERAA